MWPAQLNQPAYPLQFILSLKSLGFDEPITIEDLVLTYPNPSDGLIHFKNSDDKSLRIAVYDLTGNLIREVRLEEKETKHLVLDEPGLYFYRVNNSAVAVSGKITIR